MECFANIMHYLKIRSPLQFVFILGIFSLLLFVNQISQYGHAQNIRTFTIKSELDNKIVKLGESNKLHVKVFDRDSGQPLSGALVKAVTVYPGGTEFRTVTQFTDSSGEVSISIPTQKNLASDTVEVDVVVSQTGYPDTDFTMLFLVVSKNINDKEHRH